MSHLIIVPDLKEVSVINPSAQVKKSSQGSEVAAHGPAVIGLPELRLS